MEEFKNTYWISDKHQLAALGAFDQVHRMQPPQSSRDNYYNQNPNHDSLRHLFRSLSDRPQLATSAWQIVTREVRTAGTTLATIAIAIERTSQATGPTASKWKSNLV